jgi:hypothetical protein
MRIREIAQARVRYGYRKIRVLLNREGWDVGKYLVYRLYHLFISRKSLRDENCRAAKNANKMGFLTTISSIHRWKTSSRGPSQGRCQAILPTWLRSVFPENCNRMFISRTESIHNTEW